MAIDASKSSSSWVGSSMKHMSLLCLTFQNSALILVMHYSRIMPLVGGRRYFPSTAVLLNEVIKLTISLTVALYELSNSISPSAPATTLLHSLSSSVFSGDSWKLAIPAMLYTLQNSLQYVAVANLDAATFQITYQIKILTTAIFSVILLRRKLSARKWTALLILAIGVAIVQLPQNPGPVSAAELREGPKSAFWLRNLIFSARDVGREARARLNRRSATYQGIVEDSALFEPTMNPTVGLPAVIFSCLLSGLAGVYFEKVLKNDIPSHNLIKGSRETNLWIRNVQLSFYSVFPALFIGVIFKDGESIAKEGFFSGYNWIVWAAILLQSAGGIIVSLVINYADNIAKNFATSISILISLFLSVLFLDLPITPSYFLGTVLVLLATYLYSASESNRLPPIVIADYEKTTVLGQEGYFDLNATQTPTSAIRNEALTTSRPSTPTTERHHFRVASGRKVFNKRDE